MRTTELQWVRTRALEAFQMPRDEGLEHVADSAEEFERAHRKRLGLKVVTRVLSAYLLLLTGKRK